jgi:glycine hydroxymethyltransferase
MSDMRPIEQVDPQLAELIHKEVKRQRNQIHLIASENYISYAMMQASGSVFSNKYSEGYPGRRYYEGCEVVDEVENLAIDRAKRLFGADHANVQAHSGSQANMAAYLAVLEPGDTILGMALDQGGHLTHGSPVNFSGKLFNFVAYGVNKETEQIELEEVRRLALEHKPQMIVAGYSAYSRFIDWAAFRQIADEVGAIFLVDAAHIIGLIAGSAHPNPVPHADIVTATTHKALRGPRGGLILRAGRAEFKTYANQIVRNAKVLAGAMDDEGLRVISGGTENHMFLVDLRSIDPELTGKEASQFLDQHGVTLNRNAIPFDPRSPFITSGLRLGTPSVTSAGMMQEQMVLLGKLIVELLRKRIDPYSVNLYTEQVRELADAFPAYPADFPGHA